VIQYTVSGLGFIIKSFTSVEGMLEEEGWLVKDEDSDVDDAMEVMDCASVLSRMLGSDGCVGVGSGGMRTMGRTRREHKMSRTCLERSGCRSKVACSAFKFGR